MGDQPLPRVMGLCTLDSTQGLEAPHILVERTRTRVLVGRLPGLLGQLAFRERRWQTCGPLLG